MELEQPHETLAIATAAPIYKVEHIRLGTFLGGPLITGYMVAENYKVLGDVPKAKRAWAISIGATVLLFAIIFLIPEDVKIPNVVFPIVYCWIAYYLVQHYQGTQLTEHIANGEKVFGWGRVVLAGLISCVVTIAALFIVLFIAGALFG
ncbi:hypothetical protein D0C36_17440 [Mucilaginibacter conchicola]|uniref:Uncharacterized protein n=1 Tax=Mucilaginibacter conchicola TaxID=2303333 RepID=A0A372NP77_9SPHI|nr:hypothetical protein [Mucilaginibacter conchicola]RFZ90744.1 hypothetical protein D0C36_17440 [Mucilaginibacter conchicola]